MYYRNETIGRTGWRVLLALALALLALLVGSSLAAGRPLAAPRQPRAGDANWDDRFAGPNGANSAVNGLAANGSVIYASGSFTQVGGIAAVGIAAWDADGWSALAPGGPQQPGEPATDGGNLYVEGATGPAGGFCHYSVFSYSSVGWAELGAAAGEFPAGQATCTWPEDFGWITSLVAGEGKVYAGWFYDLGDPSYINEWNGSGWSVVGIPNPSTGRGRIDALALGVGGLYAGGEFAAMGLTGDDAVTASNIARWDGAWSALGDGVNGPVYALAGYGNGVLAGGSFTQTGTISAANIARWDGKGWLALGGGVNGPVYALAISGGDVYVGGAFSQAGGIAASNIARWDGAGWSALGSGVDGPVYTLAISGTDVYVGGAFAQAGGKAAQNLTIWHAAAPRPSSTPTPTATWTPRPVPFSDVAPSDYFYIPVQYLAAMGAISGYSNSPPCPHGATPCFLPFATATRAQALKIALLSAGIDLITPTTARFGDVLPGSAYFSVVETAAARGIVGGYADGTFRPNNPLTRGQLSKIVALTFHWKLNDPPTASFVDVPPGSPFFSYVETAVRLGVLSGYSCGSGCREFRPGNPAVRAQLARIVYNALP